MKVVALMAAAMGGACSQATGDAGEWIPWELIQGELAPEMEPPPPQIARLGDVPGRFRVVTFNVERGADVDGLARAFLEDDELSQADVVLIQEIESYPNEGPSRAARLARAIGMGYIYTPARREGDGTHGDAILSPYPLERAAVKELPFVNLPVTGDRRIAVSADVRVGDTVVHVVNLHLDTRLNITDRIVQLRPAVIDAVGACLVGGDFNTNPYLWADGALPIAPIETIADTEQAPLIDDYMRGLGFDAPTATMGPTQSWDFVESRLDAIYSREFTVTGGAVERDVDVSDHWPLWIDVALP